MKMKTMTVCVSAVVLFLGVTSAFGESVVDFNTFNIRNNNSIPIAQRIQAPWDTDMYITENVAGDGFSALTPRGGQKVGYGTSAFQGFRVNQLQTVNWDKLSGKTGLYSYLNLWVTDGTNYAIISSENDYRGKDYSATDPLSKWTEWKVFEYGPSTTSFDWLFDSGAGGQSSQYLQHNGVNTTLAELGNDITIFAGKPYGTAGVGTGAPQGGYGFNLIWGDTQSNFTTGTPYSLENLSVMWAGQQYDAGVVPEPISMVMLGGLGLGMAAARKLRRKSA